MRRWIAGVVVVGLVGCEPAPPQFDEVTCGTSDVTFVLTSPGFSPSDATVKYAGQVRWQNDDTVEHTVRSGTEGDDDAGVAFSGTLAAGASFCVECREIGDIDFFADGGASGTLTVEPPENTGGGDDTGYDPGPYGY